jgi:thioredoxin reductase
MRDVAIIGAGPYGLSLAAHLASAQVDHRIFGTAMQSWAQSMPKGMHLKSEGFASTLYDGQRRFSFGRYCAEQGLPYADLGQPVRLADFTAYGRAFQQRFVPGLEPKQAVEIRRSGDKFVVRFDDGEVTPFRRVVLAVGITHFRHVPPVLGALPDTVLTHASDHHDMSRFAGRSVAVVGGGSSATDCAAALIEAGARVQIVTRKPALKFHPGPQPRRLYDRIRWPVTTIGSGWRAVFCAHMPLVFHAMPQGFRHEVTRRYLGPVSCWFTRATVEGHATVHASARIRHATASDGRALLAVERDGSETTLEVDHVIAATGYKVDVERLGFLDPSLRSEIRQADRTPVLSRTFESSVPGLFFVGVASANCFGPLVRFACGAEFTAGRLSRHLARRATVSRPLASPDMLRPSAAGDAL